MHTRWFAGSAGGQRDHSTHCDACSYDRSNPEDDGPHAALLGRSDSDPRRLSRSHPIDGRRFRCGRADWPLRLLSLFLTSHSRRTP